MGKSNPDLIGAAVVIPLLQSAVTASGAALLTLAICVQLDAVKPFAYALLAGAVIFVMSWLSLTDRFYKTLERDTHPPTRRFRVELAAGRSLQFFDLPADETQLIALANGVLHGATLNELSFTGYGRPFTRAEFRVLRDELVRRGMAEWRSASPAQGVQLTRTGLAVFRYLAASPTFKPGHVLEKY